MLVFVSSYWYIRISLCTYVINEKGSVAAVLVPMKYCGFSTLMYPSSSLYMVWIKVQCKEYVH